MSFLKFFYILLAFILSLQSPGLASQLSVVVTIKPIHSLVANVTNGVLIPTLLTSDNTSAHTHALTPREAEALLKADLVIWIGKDYEANMQQSIKKLVPTQKLITLIETKGLTLYPPRQESIWEGEFKEAHNHPIHDHEEEGHHCSHNHSLDGHIWLDPSNAIVIVHHLVKFLTQVDPKNAAHYKQNGDNTVKRLEQLDMALKEILRPVLGKPYIVYHDSIQYLDRHFGTKAVATIVTEPGIPPKADHYLRLEYLLGDKSSPLHPVCIFEEPQFANDISRKLADKFSLPYHMIDYLGQGIQPGLEAYFTIMTNLCQDLVKGLQ